MARRRMFSLGVVDTDEFLDLPASSQALYFHLGMRADDDGFVSSPKRISAMVSASADDLRLLIAKGYIIPFESGVCVIREWRINNYIQRDRYTPTLYASEMRGLSLDANGRYFRLDTPCIQYVSIVDTQDRKELGKVRRELGEGDKAAKPPHATRFTPPSLEEVRDYVTERNSPVDPAGFIDFYASKGWMVGKSKMRDWKAACRNAERWERWNKPAANNRVRTDEEYRREEDFFGIGKN